MNKFKGTRIFCFLSMAAFLGGAIYIQNTTKNEEDNLASKKEITTQVDYAQSPYEYIVLEEDGYLVVYCDDRKTVYFRTDIMYEDLDEEMQGQIRRGYGIKDVRELYDFLENYSS